MFFFEKILFAILVAVSVFTGTYSTIYLRVELNPYNLKFKNIKLVDRLLNNIEFMMKI